MLGYFKYFNAPLTRAVLVVATSTMNYGFDNQGFATTQAMDAFQRKFGVQNAKGEYHLDQNWLALFSGLIYIGFAAGILGGSFLSARYGRRKTMFILSAYQLITATVIVTADVKEKILAGRVLNYLYVGMELAVIPVYQSEIVPGEIRGFIVGTYQFSLIFGGLVINCICLGTSGIQDERSFRIPYGLYYVIPALIMIGVFFIPESPRWLLLKDRNEEALANLKKLREGPFTEEQIMYEFETIRLAVANEPEEGKFIELFKGNNLKRTFIACGIHGFQNTCGQMLVSKFGSLIVKSLHTVSPFIMTIVFALTNLVSVFVGMTLADKIGRRPLLLTSAFLQCAGCIVLASIGTTGWPLPRQYQPVSIVMLVVVTAGFSVGFAVLSNVVTTEITALHLRDMTQRTACFMNVFGNLVAGISIPYLLNEPYAALHLQIGWVFAPIAFTAFLFAYFFVPDCKGKTLEEVDWLFNNKVPVRKFRTYKVPDLYVEHQNKTENKDKGATVSINSLNEQKIA